MSSEAAIAVLCGNLGYEFGDPELLRRALKHRSWCAENDDPVSNERLEFLGDSVLGLVVTDHLYAGYPAMSEGKLAKARAAVVSSVSLAGAARELELGQALLLGKGEETSGGRDKSSILADALEAVIGAVYLDAGWDGARTVVRELFGDRIEVAADEPGTEDFKTRLQEHVARSFESLPMYVVTDEGPDHEKRFYATVSVDGQSIGRGEGRSKKEAEQAAARAAWAFLGSESASVVVESTRQPSDNPAEAMK